MIYLTAIHTGLRILWISKHHTGSKRPNIRKMKINLLTLLAKIEMKLAHILVQQVCCLCSTTFNPNTYHTITHLTHTDKIVRFMQILRDINEKL